MTPMSPQAVTDYWRSGRGDGCITPRDKQWPEGEGFPAFLTDLIADASVLEFGCGPGRLAHLFTEGRYIGVDLSAGSIRKAEAGNPDHAFLCVGPSDPLPGADVILAHTVLLHVHDADLPATLERFNAPRVIISEVMGRDWRRDGSPPVFNRDPEDYAEAMGAIGYALHERHDRPYPHYRDTDLTMLDFRRPEPELVEDDVEGVEEIAA